MARISYLLIIANKLADVFRWKDQDRQKSGQKPYILVAVVNFSCSFMEFAILHTAKRPTFARAAFLIVWPVLQNCQNYSN
jgi:hypothetical protein